MSVNGFPVLVSIYDLQVEAPLFCDSDDSVGTRTAMMLLTCDLNSSTGHFVFF